MSIDIKVDSKSLYDMSRGLGNVIVSVAGAGVDAVNKVTTSTLVRSKAAIMEQIRFKEGYLDQKFKVVDATPQSPEAIITAADRPTVLTRFATQQLTAGAPRAKGDSFHGISGGRKQAGVRAEVKGGGDIRGGFFVPLRAGAVDGGNGMGVFTRIRGSTGKGSIRQRYGPSVDQAFKVVLNEIAPSVGAELETAALTELDNAIEKVFK